MKFRWMVYDSMKKYVLVWKISKITYWYILVCTGMTDITVYHGIWPFITVYDGMKWLKQVHTSTYKYIIVYDCFRTVSNLHTGTYWYIIVTWTYILWSTGPCCQCTRLARLKAADLLLRKDTPVHTHTQVYSSLVLTICPPVSACQWGQGESAGSGQVRCPPCTARSSALQASLQCYTDASRSPFRFHLVSRVRTTIVGPAGQHASICQMRHGFSHQQTSKSTTWK